MNRIIFFTLLIICGITTSCMDNKKGNEITQIENKEGNLEKEYKITVTSGKDQVVNLSSLVDTVSYIPLETNNRCLLSGDNFQILFFKESIFIRDNKALYQFSNSGKFIRKIGRNGRGPGEYGKVLNFAIVPDIKEIFIVPHPYQEILVFDLDTGEYKRSFTPKVRNSVNLIEFPAGTLAFPTITNINSQKQGSEPARFYFSDLYGRIFDSIPATFIRKKGNISADLTSMYKKDGSLFYMVFMADTLYKVSDKIERKPYVIIDMGKYKVDPEIVLTPEMIEKETNTLLIRNVLETKSNFYIAFMKGFKGDELKYGLYNKRGHDLVFPEGGGLTDDLDGGLPFWPKSILQDSLMVGYKNAYEFKDYIASEAFKNYTPKYPEKKKQVEQLANSLDENNNPVLMLVKLKE